MGNPDSPIDNHNFGHLFTARANEPLLNQVSIVGERALDPNATGFDWGFKAWFMEGSDARDVNRRLPSALRRAEKRTRLRAEWTAGGTTYRFFDYVPKSERPA